MPVHDTTDIREPIQNDTAVRSILPCETIPDRINVKAGQRRFKTLNRECFLVQPVMSPATPHKTKQQLSAGDET